MRITDKWRTAARYGMPFGIGLAVLAGVIGLLNLFGPSSQFRALPYFWLLAAIICAFVAGFIAARSRGSFILGVDAGAVACAVPGAVIFLMGLGSSVHYQETHPIGQYLPGIINAVIAFALLVPGGIACGAVFGGLASIPGALLGRIQANLDGANNPPTEQEDSPADDEENILTDPSAPDIVIPVSWVKGLLFLVLAFLFAAVAYSVIRSGQNSTLNWIAFSMFGLSVPLMFCSLLVSHPLLRFGEEGIAYKGAYFWLRGRARWEDVRAIFLEPASERQSMFGLFGRYELKLFFGDGGFRKIRFLSWQLPSSTPRLLHAAMIRFSQQVAENDIVVRGVE
jgi:hypothetical protein